MLIQEIQKGVQQKIFFIVKWNIYFGIWFLGETKGNELEGNFISLLQDVIT